MVSVMSTIRGMKRVMPLLLLCACMPRLGTRSPCVDSVSARAILKAYANNPTAADQRYNDRHVRIEGAKVDRIDGMAMWSGDLRLTFAEQRDVLRLSRGAAVTACCEGDGRRGSDVRFEDCRLTSVESPMIGAPQAPSAPRAPMDLDEMDGEEDDSDTE